MSTAAASAPTSAPKTPKRRSKAKKSGASVSDLILKIVSSSKERGGVSLVALKKALAANGYDVVKNNSRVKLAVRRLVANGRLIQTKGTGASGSFKIGSKAAKKPKKAKAKRKTPKKAKRKTTKKPAGAKKSPKKRRRKVLKSPEKADETAAVKKSPRPKRAKRRASKTNRARTAKK
uniref:histone H1/H5 family protein n=1 Tax=Danio rerio TaxID=7955 RepID=UPI0001A2D1F3